MLLADDERCCIVLAKTTKKGCIGTHTPLPLRLQLRYSWPAFVVSEHLLPFMKTRNQGEANDRRVCVMV